VTEKRLYTLALYSDTRNNIYYNYRGKGYYTKEYTQPKRAMDIKDIKDKVKVLVF
jgi:hypothetical protein